MIVGSNIGITIGRNVMRTQKLSISLPEDQFKFIEQYQMQHHYKTRSEVISKALRLLQQTQLEACYREANQEIDEGFDAASNDGLDKNETW